MSNLNPLDTLFNWEKPESSRGAYHGSRPEDEVILIRIDNKIHKKKNSTHKITFNNLNQDFFFKDSKVRKLAVSFDEEKKRLIFVPNPTEGIPFYKFGVTGKELSINNRVLIDKIYKLFKLSDEKMKYLLKGQMLDTFNGLTVYSMIICDFETQLPLFEKDLLGQ